MTRQVILSCLLVGSLGVCDAWAHHKEPGKTHPAMTTVRIPQTVLASGKPLPAGTYEVVVNEDRPTIGGVTSDAQRTVDFLKNGMVVATEIAEVFPAAERPVGTSSASGRPRAVVQRLRTDDFMRIAITGADARYLIHLPMRPVNQREAISQP
jgi:hypothetical protein